MPYEKVNCTNFTTDIAEDDDDSSIAVRDQPTSFVLHSSLSQPLGHQSNSNSPSSTNSMLGPMTRLLCALGSGLANEIDFGLKVVTMLTNSRQVALVSDHRFVEALVECSSVGACDCDVDVKCSCVQQFWSSKCKNDTIRSLIFDQENEDVIHLSDAESSALCPQISNLSPEWSHHYSQRVKRIADLIRRIVENIKEETQPQDTEEEIVTLEAASLNLVKFTALLLFSDDTEMVSIGVDIMTNIEISPKTQAPYCELRRLIYHQLSSFVLESLDTDLVTRSLFCLSQLATHSSEGFNRVAKDILTEALLERLIQLLTCQHDVHLVISSLEFCLAISQIHPKLLIQSNSYLVKILLNLVNCDASNHFSQNALSRIKVSDTRTRTQPLRTIICQQPTTRLLTNQVGQTVTLTVPGDNEAFVVNWLRSTYEVSDPKSCIGVNDLYAEYVKFSLKNNRRNVVSVPVFSQIVLKTFPRISLVNNNRFDGIKCKTTAATTTTTIQCKVITPQLQSQQQQQQQSQQQQPQTQTQGLLTSPILKAHLSAPPKTSLITSATSSTTVTVTNASPQPKSLIKTLLATKLQSKNTLVNITGTGKSDSDEKEETSNATTLTNAAVVTAPILSATSVPSSNSSAVLISTPTVTGGGQPTQQLILVRTVIGQNNQGNIVGVPPGQMRLILPASVLTQQRSLIQPTVNGAVNNVTLNHISQSSAVSISNTPQPVTCSSFSSSTNTPTTSSNDILMKAVLGSGIVADNSNEPAKSSPVKSSPLLNVLLDKGKLPDNQSVTSQFNIPQQLHLQQPQQQQQQNKQLTNQPNQQIQPETQKMFILATKPAVSANQTNSVFKNGTKEAESDPTPTLTNGDISSNSNDSDRESNKKDFNSNPDPVSNVSNPSNNVQDASKLQQANKRPNDEIHKEEETLSKKTKVENVESETVKSTSNGEVNFTKSNSETESEVPKVSTASSTESEIVNSNIASTSSTATATVTTTTTCTTTNTNTNSNSNTNINTHTQSTTVVPPPLEFACEWLGCQR